MGLTWQDNDDYEAVQNIASSLFQMKEYHCGPLVYKLASIPKTFPDTVERINFIQQYRGYSESTHQTLDSLITTIKTKADRPTNTWFSSTVTLFKIALHENYNYTGAVSLFYLIANAVNIDVPLKHILQQCPESWKVVVQRLTVFISYTKQLPKITYHIMGDLVNAINKDLNHPTFDVPYQECKMRLGYVAWVMVFSDLIYKCQMQGGLITEAVPYLQNMIKDFL